jgi:sugar (pentulose or hexulose) kinase
MEQKDGVKGQLIVVIDAGTTGVRAVAVAGDTLVPVHAVYERIPDEYVKTPQSGWVELDPEGLWSVTRGVVERLLAKVGPVHGIALTTQRASVLLTDENGVPLTPFVPWQGESRERETGQARHRQSHIERD